MTIVLLGRDTSAQGTWMIDYDDVGLTVGHTCTSPGGYRLTLTVKELQLDANGNPVLDGNGNPTIVAQYTKDVSGDFGKGRVVDFSNVPNSAVPVHVKGKVYPFVFSGQWQPV